MFTALRDLFYNLFPINLPGIWWILSERWSCKPSLKACKKGAFPVAEFP